MKLFKKGIGGVMIAAVVTSIMGCSRIQQTYSEVKNLSQNSHYPITITTYNYDKEPVKITFDKEPESVVAIYQNSIETLFALGLEDKIKLGAGLDHNIKEEYKDELKEIKYIDKLTPDKKDILDVNPDFILSWHSIFSDRRLGDIDSWHEDDINTYTSLNSGVTENRTVENEITDILNLGKIFNVEDRAIEIANEINSEIEKILKSVDKGKEENTLIVEYNGDDIYTYGENTLGGDMVDRLNAKLLNPKGGNITEEELVKLNPDSIFVVYMDRMDSNIPEQEVNKILHNPKFKEISAVKENRVNSIALGEMYCSGVRTVDGINTFAQGLYGNSNY